MVAISSLPFGSNRLLPAAIVGLTAAAWLGVFLLLQLLDSRRTLLLDRDLWLPVGLLCIVFGWITVQTLPGLSGAPIWAEARRLLGVDVVASISLNPELSLQHLMRLIGYALIAYLAYLLASKPDEARKAILVFIAVAAIHAAAGIVLALLDIKPASLASFPPNDRRVRGGFVNADHFAFFCGIALLAAVCEWLDFRRREERRRAFDRKLIGVNRLPLIWSPWRWIAMALLAAALLGSQSRAGAGATFLGISVALSLQPGRKGRIAFRPQYAMVFAALAIATVALGPREVLGRFTAVGDALSTRIEVMKLTLYAMQDYWLTGSGFGTFPHVYPAYRLGSVDSHGRWMQAHNSFLQNFLELGVIAGAMFYLALIWFYVACVRGFFRRRRERLFTHIAMASGLMAAAHSMVDFPLEIPANAYAAMLFLGMGLRQRGVQDS